MEEAQTLGENTEYESAVGSEEAVVPTNEWTLAALAHASILLTLILSIAGGVGVFVGPLIPLVVYLGYKERSRFVAFHALQSLVYQVGGVVAFVVLVAVTALWVALAWVVSGLLAPVLIGFLLMPFALLLTVLVALAMVCAPFAWLGYGLYAAYQVYQGRDFRYWWVGNLLERHR